MSVLLHIGLYKTGSTAIQLFLRDEAEMLASHGARFPHGWLRRDNHLELALVLMDRDRMSPARTRGTEWRDDIWCAQVRGMVHDDLAAHHDVVTVLSAEDTALLRSDAEVAALRDLVGDAHVVVYLREPMAFLAAWEDTLTHKLGIAPSADPDSYAHVGAASWQVDYGARLGTWQRHFSRLTVLNYDRIVAREGTVIPSFTRLLDINDADLPELTPYWLNGRGSGYDHRVPGNRWTNGLSFGETPPVQERLGARVATRASADGGSARPRRW